MRKLWDNPVAHAMPPGIRVPAEFHVRHSGRDVRIAPATVLAPMAGVTDTVFRRFIRAASMLPPGTLHATSENFASDNGAANSTRKSSADLNHSATDAVTAAVNSTLTNQQSGCGLLMTEFTSADGLARMRESKRKRYLTFYDDEHPIAAQLFGSNPETMADAARIVEDTGFDIVDLNLGCPAKRVVNCNGGSGLLRDLPKIGQLFRALRAAVSIPFTVKFRMGWSDDHIVCVELAKMAESEGLNAVALHARTREQGYSGQARWEWIAAVKDAVTIPVIGNGDIRTPEDACAMIAQTGCDAVMIGRTAPANPWIFRQIAQYTATGSYDSPEDEDRYAMIRAYFQMLLDEMESDTEGVSANVKNMAEATGKMKQFASWFTHGVTGGAALRKAIYEAKSGDQILSAVESFFESAQRSPEKLELVSE